MVFVGVAVVEAVNRSAEPVELSSSAKDFLAWLTTERGRAANTLAAYRRDLLRYHSHLAQSGRSPFDAVPDDVVSFIRARQLEGMAPTSVIRMMSAIRGLHRFCVMEGIRDDDPAADVEIPARPRALPKALSVAQVTALIDSVTGDDAVARRARAILEVLYGTGCRISELVTMSLADVDLFEGLARVTGKGSKERIVPLGRHAATALEQWFTPEGRSLMEPARWRRRGDAEAVFLNQRGGRLTRQGIWLIVRQYGRAAGLSGLLTPHVLRHSCATHMLDGGADVRFVQELLGHVSVSTTQIYTKVSTERLWNVYRSAHPRAVLGTEVRPV